MQSHVSVSVSNVLFLLFFSLLPLTKQYDPKVPPDHDLVRKLVASLWWKIACVGSSNMLWCVCLDWYELEPLCLRFSAVSLSSWVHLRDKRKNQGKGAGRTEARNRDVMPSCHLAGEEEQLHKLQRNDRITSERMQIPASLSVTRSAREHCFL